MGHFTRHRSMPSVQSAKFLDGSSERPKANVIDEARNKPHTDMQPVPCINAVCSQNCVDNGSSTYLKVRSGESVLAYAARNVGPTCDRSMASPRFGTKPRRVKKNTATSSKTIEKKPQPRQTTKFV